MEVDLALEDTPPSAPCALILVGRSDETVEQTRRWLTERAGLVLLYVDVIDDIVRFTVQDPRRESQGLERDDEETGRHERRLPRPTGVLEQRAGARLRSERLPFVSSQRPGQYIEDFDGRWRTLGD
jgi:hypothetical protein